MIAFFSLTIEKSESNGSKLKWGKNWYHCSESIRYRMLIKQFDRLCSLHLLPIRVIEECFNIKSLHIFVMDIVRSNQNLVGVSGHSSPCVLWVKAMCCRQDVFWAEDGASTLDAGRLLVDKCYLPGEWMRAYLLPANNFNSPLLFKTKGNYKLSIFPNLFSIVGSDALCQSYIINLPIEWEAINGK